MDVVVYQHGAPQEAVAGDNYDIISEERTAQESRVDVPAIIRRVFNVGFPNTTAPRGNTLLVNLSVGTRSNALQGTEIELWVNGAALPDVVIPEGGSAVDFELNDTHRTGTTWTIEARTTTSTGGQLERLAWTWSVVRFKEDFETFMDFTPGDAALRTEIPWVREFNRPVIISAYSDFTVEIRDRSSNGISTERHRLYPEEIHSFLASEASSLATKRAHVFSAVFSIDGTASLIEAYDRSKSRPGLANPRLSFVFANATEDGADLMTSIRGVDGTSGLHQTIAEGDISHPYQRTAQGNLVKNILTALSGGVDSAAALYYVLEQEKVWTDTIHCYHLKNIRRATTCTADAEWISFLNIQQWFNARYEGIHWHIGANIDWREWPIPMGSAQFQALIRGTMAKQFGCSRIFDCQYCR